MAGPVHLLAVVQNGRLAYEALLFMASWARHDNRAAFRVVLAEPQPGPLWEDDPRVMDLEIRAMLQELGAEIRPFESRIWGSRYPHGNKIEALGVLEPEAPFVFCDTDTLFLAALGDVPLEYAIPAASERVEPSWPKEGAGLPARETVWAALYGHFGLTKPPIAPYFNAGFYAFENAGAFAREYAAIAQEIEAAALPELEGQSLRPWLDQVALPLVLRRLGGPGVLPQGQIDGRVTCHWRTLPLLYARESAGAVAMLEEIAADQPIKRLLRRWEPARRMVYRGEGAQIRQMFAGALPGTEAELRRALKAEGLWVR